MGEIQEIELLKAEDGLGFNIRGGKDAEYVREDNGIFVTKIRERGSAARLLAAGDRPCLHEGDKLLEIDGNSLTNIDHNEAVNLFVTSGSVVKLKFVPGAYQKIIHQREIMQEVRFRLATHYGQSSASTNNLMLNSARYSEKTYVDN